MCLFQNVFQDLPSDIHITVSDRLFISLTSAKFHNSIVSKFESKEHLCDALTCSCFLPMFSGYEVPRFRNSRYLDGGLTNQMPVIDSDTVKISPFSGKWKHICPEDKGMANITMAQENIFINKQNLVRGIHAIKFLDSSRLSRYYKEGHDRTFRYIEEINR